MKRALAILFLALSFYGRLAAQVSYDANMTNIVKVTYNGSSASNVVIASNLQSYVTATVDGGAVSIVQKSTVSASTCGEIIYQLTGTSANGSFILEGNYKATIELHGLNLTNLKGPAINILNGKRIEIKPLDGTISTLTDGTSTEVDAWKSALYCKGHIEFKGKGTLNVYGNYAHAIYCKEYMSIKNCTINVCSAVKDALHCREYFLMESGKVSLSGFASDGIEGNIDGTTSTGETAEHENEDSGNIYIMGGSLLIDMSTSSGDSIKPDGEKIISADATVDITNTTTAIENIYQTEQALKVYNLLGVLVGVYDSPQMLNALPKGTYVIKNSSITKKISVL